MGVAESRPSKIVLDEAEELALFTYIVDNCGINPPIPESLKTYNERGCSTDIPAIIRKYGKSSGLDMIVYRGQYDKREITISESKPFFSVTTNPDYAETFASKVWDTENQEYHLGIDCCKFKIHLQNVMILDLAGISFVRVLKNPPPLVNADDSNVPILAKFKDLLGAESEILVLGGGKFYTSPTCTQEGCIEPPDFDDVPEKDYHQFHETWYSMPIRKNKRKMEAGGGRTRRFKKHRLMSKAYCKKTTCRRMGFTQKASCRPYKNCYK
jgi:hypothetical protein